LRTGPLDVRDRAPPQTIVSSSLGVSLLKDPLSRASHFVADHHIAGRSLGLALAALGFAVVAETAQANGNPIEAVLREKVAENFEIVDVPQHLFYETVYEGADLDGDGAGDLVNPTGHEVREHDAFGYGHFGARRDGGTREHEGVDYVGFAGQDVLAPIAGKVTGMGYAYGNAPDLKYIEITNAALHHKVRVFYVDPQVAIGEYVEMGEEIGVLKTLQHKYPGITDHVHMELYAGGQRINAEEMIVARIRRVQLG
jgi:murein DD-endopeptidase MepM/ murein hydrolase activator NlpD